MYDKIALITGGATGIGKATALILERRGVKVVITVRRDDRGREAVQKIEAAGGEASFVNCDVDSEEAARRTIEDIIVHYGRLDLAVNNVGISNENKAIGASNTDAFNGMLQLLSGRASFATGHVLNMDGGFQAK